MRIMVFLSVIIMKIIKVHLAIFVERLFKVNEVVYNVRFFRETFMPLFITKVGQLCLNAFKGRSFYAFSYNFIFVQHFSIVLGPIYLDMKYFKKIILL